MGWLRVGATHNYEFDDSTLAHLRSVITNKLLKKESFLFTWQHDGTEASMWLHPAVDITFEFDSVESISIDRNRLEQMLTQANSAGGLRLSTDS